MAASVGLPICALRCSSISSPHGSLKSARQGTQVRPPSIPLPATPFCPPSVRASVTSPMACTPSLATGLAPAPSAPLACASASLSSSRCFRNRTTQPVSCANRRQVACAAASLDASLGGTRVVARRLGRQENHGLFASGSDPCLPITRVGGGVFINTRVGGAGPRKTGTSALLKAETVTIVGNTSVDIPLHEEPIPLAEYLGDVNRIFYNIFPDRSRSEKLSDTLWRIRLEQHDFLFFRVTPVVDMQVWVEWVEGSEDPILRLSAARCDLGPSLGGLMRAAQFELDVNGRLFPNREPVASTARTHMYGVVDIKVRLLKIAAFGFIPAKGVEKAGAAVCNAILNALQQTVSHTLLSSYKEFCAAERRGPKAEVREPMVGELREPKPAELVTATTID
eukprot:jgi/Mesvir1/25936/Mv20930-RA.1